MPAGRHQRLHARYEIDGCKSLRVPGEFQVLGNWLLEWLGDLHLGGRRSHIGVLTVARRECQRREHKRRRTNGEMDGTCRSRDAWSPSEEISAGRRAIGTTMAIDTPGTRAAGSAVTTTVTTTMGVIAGGITTEATTATTVSEPPAQEECS